MPLPVTHRRLVLRLLGDPWPHLADLLMETFAPQIKKPAS